MLRVISMRKLNEIRLRDPFVLRANGKYYLYGTIGETEGERNLYVHESDDLRLWSEPKPIFTLPHGTEAKGELWAPEVHAYRGRFYLFVSALCKNGLRGVFVAAADKPDGAFSLISDTPITPPRQSCIDGTLYLENGVPYIVYSHDWPDNYIESEGVYVGSICAVRVNDELTERVGEPFLLFNSSDAPVSHGTPVTHDFCGKTVTRYGSDGPFLIKDGEKLLLLWSPIPRGCYIVAYAVSDGGIHGTWRHGEVPLFDGNGGHPMVFEGEKGQRLLCIHYPEVYFHESALLLPLDISNGIPRLL